MFEKREKLVFSLLEEAEKNFEFTVIGGYAVNAFTPPRFSVDCDIVVKDPKTMRRIEAFLKKKGFIRKIKGTTIGQNGEFISLKSTDGSMATFDIMSQVVEDRLSGLNFPAGLLFKHSSKKIIYGKSSPIRIEVLTADPEILFAMKAASARTTDIRDMFMLASININRKKLIEIQKLVKVPEESLQKAAKAVNSKDFTDSLQGVYGKLPETQIAATKKKLMALLKIL